MVRAHTLEFDCQKCSKPVRFSLFEIEHHPDLTCAHCWNKYIFEDEGLKQQLRKFEGLCRSILEAEEILGLTSIGVDVGDHHVKIPFKLLLTRLTSRLDLKIGDANETLSFRFEPLQDSQKKIS
jgi:DNA-directed RNA polymerase subunit RPC12/RpoP